MSLSLSHGSRLAQVYYPPLAVSVAFAQGNLSIEADDDDNGNDDADSDSECVM